ncbi:glycoside hydrolase domain-containing protein [Leuconostoc sp. S50]|uniref:glycoside hydrolase domain-containing protein n=2 Tax=unclassified Leuconostoc TaxID=2685106 RepID=UPI001D316774|nr:glycoside hydrolase domain-containing protein [Leuconostoc sp. S50]MBK0052492.1 DUF1906 domain-containing protein [Leuconostoc sp. S50]
MDAMVLETQEWLNKTYGSVTNYTNVPQNGQTGWATIYGLIQGLQHELGITIREGAPAFGDATAAAYDEQVVPKLKNGYKSNIVYLIQGAFWAKGINPGSFTGVYSDDTTAAIESLQSDAGIPTTGVLNSELAQALFDMSAFVLVSGGDSDVRKMQQYLNANYRQYTGILPADGIYQRATNTALIYGVQAELGLGSIANGFWGPTTIATYRSAFNSGLSQRVIQLVQYALYVNMKEYLTKKGGGQVTFNGNLDAATQNVLSEFQSFMVLEPVKAGQPDSTTMYSLMLSSGSPARNFFGIDTSYQLDNAMIKALVDYEVNYVGRYLTGSVGVGDSQRNKNLTRTEAQNILDAGLKLVPIYQDNNPHLTYFDYDQGMKDAKLAVSAALNIGIPNGHTIYFAVDMDMTDDEITSAAIPYFNGVAAGISHYNIGVYGTRNVSSRVSQSVSSVKFSYVSNMSTGYSGNLGFSQPINWAFDQFFEDDNGVGTLPALDRVAVSHRDEGVNQLSDSVQHDWVDDTNWTEIKNWITSGKLVYNGKPYTWPGSNGLLRIDVSYQAALSVGNLPFLAPTVEIKNGKIDSSLLNYLIAESGPINGFVISGTLDSLDFGIETGYLTLSMDPAASFSQNQPGGHVRVEVTGQDPRAEKQEGTVDSAIIFDIYINNSPLAFAAVAKWTAEDEKKFQEGLETNIKVTFGIFALIGVARLAPGLLDLVAETGAGIVGIVKTVFSFLKPILKP